MTEPTAAAASPDEDSEVAMEQVMADVDVPPCDALFTQQWSSVPVECRIWPGDSKDDAKTHVCRFIAPRQSYLFLHLETITQALAPHAKEVGNVWFTWQREASAPPRFVPLHLPLAVAMDWLYACEGAHTIGMRRDGGCLIPLRLLVHFKSPPGDSSDAEEQAMRRALASTITIKDREMAYVSYEQLLKQSIALRFNRTLSKRVFGRTFRALFDAVSNNNSNEFWALRFRLLSVVERMGDEMASSKCAGIVVHYRGHSKVFRARPSGEMLGVFLRENVPLPAFRSLSRNQCHSTKEHAAVLVQGMRPRYGTPLDALVEMCSAADLSLHIVVLDHLVST